MIRKTIRRPLFGPLIVLLIAAGICAAVLVNSRLYANTYDQASTLYAAGDKEQALPLLQSVYAYHGADQLASYIYAENYMAEGRYLDALNALVFKPNTVERHNHFRMIYYETRVFECLKAYCDRYPGGWTIDSIHFYADPETEYSDTRSRLEPIVVITLSGADGSYTALFEGTEDTAYACLGRVPAETSEGSSTETSTGIPAGVSSNVAEDASADASVLSPADPASDAASGPAVLEELELCSGYIELDVGISLSRISSLFAQGRQEDIARLDIMEYHFFFG